MSIFNNNILAGAASQSTTTPVYAIDQSIRFNNTGSDSTSHYFSKTFSSAGNQKTWTLSWWMKMGNGSDRRSIFSRRVGTGGDDAFRVRILEDSAGNSSQMDIYFGKGSGNVVDGPYTKVAADERMRIYVNGRDETEYSGSSGTFQYDTAYATWNTASTHNIGRQMVDNDNWMDGYMAEIVFIDGTAHNPTDFGEYTTDGIWIPKNIHDQSFTFGTNGFYLTGQDASNLGNDYQTSDRSGTTNDWTSNNFGTHDQVADSPTNNFAVTNAVNSHPNVALSEGNLKQVNSGTSIAYGSSSTILLTSGKWYVEWRLNTLVSNEYPVVGLYSTNEGRSPLSTASSFPGLLGTFADIGFGANDGNRFEDNTTTSSWANAYANGDIAAMAIDMDNKKIWFGHNNSGSFVWQASGDPAAGSNEANTKAFASDIVVGVAHYGSSSVTFNYGQDGTFGGTETAQGNSDGNGIGNFYYAPPTGFLAICTKNLGS